MTTDTDYDDDLDVDDDGPTVELPADQPRPSSFKANAQVAVARWKAWPRWARWVSIPVGGYVAITALGVVGSVLSGGDSPAVAAPTATTAQVDAPDPLSGLPALSPLVVAVLRPEDRAEFSNKVRAVTADGTSICQVFFGVETVERDGVRKSVWSLTTPAMQARGTSGVSLPSSTWPALAFYGSPCDVPDADVRLANSTTSTTATAPTTTTAPVENPAVGA